MTSTAKLCGVTTESQAVNCKLKPSNGVLGFTRSAFKEEVLSRFAESSVSRPDAGDNGVVIGYTSQLNEAKDIFFEANIEQNEKLHYLCE